jgi:hypothetical protein
MRKMQARAVKPKRGRPPIAPALRREKFDVRLERWMIDWADAQDKSRGELVEEALKEKHQLTPP